MSDPLSPSSLITKSQSLCSPSTLLSSPSSVLLLLLHSLHSSLSFRLISPTPQEDNKLPSEWPSSLGGDLKLKYKHDQSSLQFVISVVDLGDKLMVVGNAVDVRYYSLSPLRPPSLPLLRVSFPPPSLTRFPSLFPLCFLESPFNLLRVSHSRLLLPLHFLPSPRLFPHHIKPILNRISPERLDPLVPIEHPSKIDSRIT